MSLSLDQEEISFDAREGLKCRAWFYAPKERPSEGSPVVIMAHGLGALKNFRLDAFAKHFALNGIAAFAFDYRHWGESEGSPRNLLDIEKQQEDYFSAIDYVSTQLNSDLAKKYPKLGKVVDPERIGIWGSSFSGGHVIAVADKYPKKDRIKAIVTQVPFADGYTATLNFMKCQGLGWGLWIVCNAIYDLIKSALGFSRNFVNIIYPKEQKGSSPGALLITDECEEYFKIIPEGYNFPNKVNAGLGINMMFYRPVIHAPNITAPVIGLYALNDSLCTASDVRRLLDAIPGEKEVHELTGGHFDAYGKDFDQVASLELNFLKNKL